MPNNDNYDESSDTYATPTDAERLAYVEGQVKVLLRMVTALSYPNQRNTGGAVDSQIAMGGK